MEVFYFTDFTCLITFYLFKFIFRNELQKAEKCFFSLCHSLALDTGLEKTRTALLDSV